MEQTDIQATKAYLSKVRLYDIHIDNRLEELDKLKDLTIKITQTLKQDTVQGGNGEDKLGTMIAKIVDLEDEIDHAIDVYVGYKNDVLDVINEIQSPDILRVMHKRYICGKSLDTIANEIGYSTVWVSKLHGKGLYICAGILRKKRKI